MQIEYKKVKELKPYEKNPRKNDDAVKYVQKSIEEFGFKVPIVVDSSNVIVAGHTRYKAAKNLKMDEVPCIVADDLTPEQIKAFRLADNKVGEFAEWDFGLLEMELEDILEIDMEQFGFNFDEVEELQEEIKEDDFDEEPPEEPVTKPGDLWKLGEHYLLCGDSTSTHDVDRLLGGAESRPCVH